jgi:hypothetical protein
MSYRASAARLAPEIAVSASCEDLDLSQLPDPEPGWATANPDRALAFFYISPRPCAALEELMQLK